jgi:hypothetical protein
MFFFIYKIDTEISNNSWLEQQPYVIGSYSMHPLTTSMKQRLILQYLTPLAEYQEVNKYIFHSQYTSVKIKTQMFLPT